MEPLIPALLALVLILLTKRAALSLFIATLSGCLLLAQGRPSDALLSLFKDHLFPALTGAWHLGPIIFTLTLGAFATLLEQSGGFQTLLQRLISGDHPDSDRPRKKLLFSIYGLGLLCFFDGLANAILLGRVARPMTDTLRISRQFLAYLIDSTSSAVACVAFISTWIATQLSLIEDGLRDSPIEASPTALYFASIPANPYCLLTLFLIPLVIWKNWHPLGMKKAETESRQSKMAVLNPNQKGHMAKSSLSSVIIPLLTLLISVPFFIYLWQDGQTHSWSNAFSSSAVPHAMVAAGFTALFAACLAFPSSRRKEIPAHLQNGASSLMPALIILIIAWCLGSVFRELGTAKVISQMLTNHITMDWLPVLVFLTAAITSFLTGSSWGTMGLLMPLVLPAALELGSEWDATQLRAALPLSIGAVFGGAVFGDHCSPFSDTTIVSALAAGCTPSSHVSTQLPYALLTAALACTAYILMAAGLSATISTIFCVVILAALIIWRKS